MTTIQKTFSRFCLAGCLLVAAAVPCGAGQSHYECVVLTANRLPVDGSLSPHWSLKSQIGKTFTADRERGRVIGGPLDNADMKIELVDKGSAEMSFQVFARSNQRTHTSQLKIEEFRPAETKPFVGTTTLYYPGVYTGTCK